MAKLKVKKNKNNDTSDKFLSDMYDVAKSNSEKEKNKKNSFTGFSIMPPKSMDEVGKTSSRDLENFRKKVNQKK